MIKLFDIQNKVVVPTEHCYTLDSIKKIIEAYPKEHMKIIAYLFYMNCQSEDMNPFFHMIEDDKEEVILKELDIDFSMDDPLIEEAMDFCKKLYETETSRAYEAMKKALDNMALYLKTTSFRDGKDGNVLQILSLAKQFDDVRKSYKGVYKDLQEEQTSHVRGNQQIAYDQK